MNMEDFEPVSAHSAQIGRGRRKGHHPGGGMPSWGAAMLGVVCVVGVFGVLGLLYSFG
jgi:hypothetical protein